MMILADVAFGSHESRVTVIVASSLVSNSNMLPGPTVGPLPVVQHAPCLCVDQGCFKSTHLKAEAVCWEIWCFLAKCSIQTLAACIYLLWEICVKSNNTVLRMLK
jgi:hypothetical protein